MAQYPTVNRSDRSGITPGKDTILSCLAVISRAETADYMVQQYEQTLKQAGVWKTLQEPFQLVVTFAENMSLQENGRKNPWLNANGAEEIPSREEHYRDMMAKNAAQLVQKEIGHDVHIGYAMNDESRFVRAVSVDNKLVKPEVSTAVDELMSTWLFKHNAVCENGVIYATVDTDDGRKIQRTAQNQAVTVDPQVVDSWMQDPGKDGFGAFLKQHNLEATILRRPYPETPAPAVEAKAEHAPDSRVNQSPSM